MPKRGLPDCASVARSEVFLSKILAVAALPMARSTLPISAPSWRWNATRLPPASTTATQYGMPKLAALASAADNICLASSSVRLVNVRGMTESSGGFDPDGLRVHEGVRPEGRELATVAAVLAAADRTARVGGGHAVDEHPAGVEIARDFASQLDVPGPEIAAQTELAGI